MTERPCAEDPELWFSDRPTDENIAVGACLTRCDFVDACRRAVVKSEAHLPAAARRWGVWGGITPAQRSNYARYVALAEAGGPS